MKKTLAIVCFCFSFYSGMAQNHTYNACCRYSKGNVMGDCSCPGCQKDKNDEIKASQEETKQMHEKAALEQAKNVERIRKFKEEEDKKIAEKAKENKVEIPTNNNVQQPARIGPLVSSGFTVFKNEEYVAIKNGEKVVFKSTTYDYISEINKENNYFKAGNWSKNSRENNVRVVNTSGKIMTIEGIDKFKGIKYNEKENCIYLTILTGKSTHCLRPYEILHSEVQKGEAVEYRSGYFTEEYINLMIRHDAEGGEQWGGRCEGTYGEVTVYKVDNNLRVINKFRGYVKVYDN